MFFKTQFPQKKTAVFSTWLDNRTKLVGSEAEEAGNLQPDYYFDGMEKDTVRYPHDTVANYIHLIDEAVADTAAAVIRRIAPDLSWIYLEYTDDMGHRYGNSQQIDNGVRILDKQMQRIWDAIQYRQQKFNEEWVIYITTDHGREDNGYHHGSQSQRERTTWIVTNAKGLNERFKKQQAAIVDIMPTIADFLRISLPKNKKMEIDGVSLTGKISATDAEAVKIDEIIVLKWKVVTSEGKAKIWLSTTNHFKTGMEDEYHLVSEVPVANGSAKIDVKQNPSDFYKIVIEMPNNSLNRWVMVKN